MSSNKTKEYFAMLNSGEKFIVVLTVFMAVVTLASFICSLTSYLITQKTQNLMDSIVDFYDNGTIYSDNDCFGCTNTGCGDNVPPNSPCMTIRERIRMENSHSQEFGKTTPTTIGVIEFPQSDKTGATVGSADWFAEHIRIKTGSDLIITGSLVGNAINSLQIGTFDYINNQTTVCNHNKALEGPVYYVTNPADTTQRYLCICVAIPPLLNTFGESCAQFL